MVGVVIPAYKRKDCLRKTLTSLTLQTKKSFYVIVVDDHSPEPLKDVVQEFKGKFHLKYIYLEENGGPGIARQAGLNYCYDKGFNFVVFLDSDDYLFPHALARLYREINLNDADIASANFCVENDKGKNLLTQAKNKTFVHGKMYRTAFLKENNITFSSLRTNEDLAFNLKAMNSTSKIHFMDEELQLFHDDAQSITRCGENNKNLAIDYMEAIYEACVFLKNKNLSIEDMFLNIVNCYNVYQIFLLLDGKPTNEHKEHIRWLLSQDTFKKQLTESVKLNKISEMVNQMSCINGKLKQFKQTFLQWLEEFESENSSN